MLKIIGFFAGLCILFPLHARAADEDISAQFNQMLSEARNNCAGIATKLKNLQTMAGVNTVVTGVGTLAAGGALYAGITKSKIDKQAAELEAQLDNIENMSDKEFLNFLKNFAAYEEARENYASVCSQKKQLEHRSKQMGNWRTGLMAGNTVTAIAGTVIANKNKNDALPIAEHIQSCLGAIKDIKTIMGQALVSGQQEMYTRLKTISDTCGALDARDLDKVGNNSKVAMISSGVNIGTGTVGTITSAAANTNKVRSNNTDAGKKKEKNLNTAANVFAGVSTAASGVSTVFNAITLKAVNSNLKIAQSCEEALY